MDSLLLTYVSLILLVIIITLKFIISAKSKKVKIEEHAVPVQQVHRAAGTRAGRRMQQLQRTRVPEPVANANEDNNDENIQPRDKTEIPDVKMGAKKRAKLEAKAEKKAQKELQEQEREMRKKREEKLQQERIKQSEKELDEEKAREEAEQQEREERERQELEEYLKMKESFSVEEEGFAEEENNDNLLQEFIDHIKNNKVVFLAELASKFNLKTAKVVKRIQDLQLDGILTGVIDDRGKFIYISRNELEAVAMFVKQRGRISISELAEHSNRLIDLNPQRLTA